MTDDVLTFSHEHVLAQMHGGEYRNGYFVLKFYADGKNRPSTSKTDRTALFYLYPYGGTLRDEDFQLLFYDSRYDTYRGFKPPIASSEL